MKFLSQLFEARGTVWKERAFRRAFLKLTAVYLLIIAMVISVFSWLVVFQVENKLEEKSLHQQAGSIQITEAEALAKARSLHPNDTIDKTSYELQNGTLLFTVDFDDGSDLEFDVFTGELIVQADTPAASFYELMTDEIDEIIWLLGLVVFLAASIGAIVVVRATLSPIAESAKKQNQFVSDAAHELRNPLAALKATLQTEQRANPKHAFAKETVQDLVTEVDRLIATTESLLKLEQSHTSLDEIPVKPEELVTSVIGRLEKMAKEKGVTFKVNTSNPQTKLAQADGEAVLYNLIHNAVKFADSGSVISVTWEGKTVSVHNTGELIPESDLPRIFDRFYKVEKARTQGVTHSNGLGLAIVKSVLDKTGSKIVVTSNEKDGTTFVVNFS